MSNPQFVIKTLPLTAVKLWKDNPRKNDDSAEKLSEVLKVHGVRTPIVVWEKDMTIYKGNTTWKAAKLAGIKEIPVAITKFKDKAEAIAYALADNKASEWSSWDDKILKKLFDSKEMLSSDLAAVTGFSEKEIKSLKVMESVEMDDIPDVDLQGDVQTGGMFIVIRFQSTKVHEKVANAFGLGKGKRVVNWDDVKEMVQI